jgi:chemotaxis protein methyltransferase CheR
VEPIGLHLTEDDFKAFSQLVRAKAGINLHEGKRELVRARLSRRVRECNFLTFRDYYDYVVSDETGDELIQVLDSISTNLTNFFREPKHFSFMNEKMLPDLVAERQKKGPKRIRIWSAGCSTGEEPYSIAMTVLDFSQRMVDWDFKILATDISTRVLRSAWEGEYRADRMRDVPVARLRKYFTKGMGNRNGWFRVRDDIRQLVIFRRFNLMEPFPFKHPLDLIFCRNVMIYFDKATQARLVKKFHGALNAGGYLFIGHSESLTGVDHGFKYVQPTVYRK